MFVLRIIYSLKQGWLFRQKIKSFIVDPKLQAACVTDINFAQYIQLGIKAIILDFDGVLAAHAEPMPYPEVCLFLDSCIKTWGKGHVFILTNKPTLERQTYFARNYPDIIFIIAAKKKPYPDGIYQIIKLSGLQPKELMLVDDRLGTGILATVISGIAGCWITKPYTNFAVRPIRESFFKLLRTLDYICFSLF